MDFLKRDRIYRNQLVDGLLSVPYIEAVRARQVALEEHREAVTRANSIQDELSQAFSDAAMAAASDAAQRSAWAGGRNAFSNPDPGAPAEHSWNGQAKVSVSEHLRLSAKELSERAADLDRRRERIELGAAQSVAAASAHRLVAMRERAHLSATAVRDEVARHQANVDIVKAKINAACDDGGALNFAAQEGWIRSRLESDFRSLAARIPVLQSGLRQVFGTAVPVASSLHRLFPKEFQGLLGAATTGPEDAMNAAIAWTRAATELLIAQRHADERTAVTLGLASLLGRLGSSSYKGSRRASRSPPRISATAGSSAWRVLACRRWASWAEVPSKCD